MPARAARRLPVLMTAAAVAGAVLAPPALASPRSTPDASVVVAWNVVAEQVISAGNPVIPSSAVHYGLVQLAVHDAVVAVEGRYRPYLRGRAPRRGGASTDVAVATAAHHVLAHQFPASATVLLQHYARSLADGPGGRAERQGQRIGRAAAARVIEHRALDVLGSPVAPLPAAAPGVWQSVTTPPAPMAVGWLGFLRPLVLRSPTQFPLPGPDPITSAAYARDLAEVEAHGTAADASEGAAARAQTGLFYNHNAVQQAQAAMRLQVVRRGLDAVEAARAFALLGASTADALIACWRGKYDHAYWRPVTAIPLADSDGNPATTAQPGWTPRVTTPNYPEYPSGHACAMGAASGTFSALFGADSVDVTFTSSASATPRHYRTAAELDAETMDARIWLGLHFRTAMTDGNALGHQVAAHVARHELRPVHRWHHRH